MDPKGLAVMSSAETPAPSLLSKIVANRREVAIGLAIAGVLFAAVAIWWGVWGFARSGDRTPAKVDGKLVLEDLPKAAEAEVDSGKPKKSPDYQIAAIWIGGLSLLSLLSAAWLYTQPADPSNPATAARTEVLTFGGTAGLLTVLCGSVLGYRWHQSAVKWIGGGDPTEAKWVLYAAAVFMAGLLIMFASLQLARTEQRTHANLRRVLYGFNSVFVGLLLLLVLICVNVFAFIKVPNTLATNESAFQGLSEPSKELLHSINQPVHVYLILEEGYVRPLAPGITYNTMFSDCRGLLTECEENSRFFHAHYLSPTFDPEKIPVLMDRLKVKEADRDQMGMLVAVGENEESTSFIRVTDLIDVENRALVFQGENKLMTELMYLGDSGANEKIYFTQGHGELEMDGASGGDKSVANMVQYLRDRRLTVEPLTIDATNPKVPDDAAVIVMAGIRRTIQPDDPIVNALREFTKRPNKPGKLLLFLPAFRNPQGVVGATGLESLLAELGVDVDPSSRLVAVPNELPFPLDVVELSPVAQLPPDLARVVGRGQLYTQETRPVRPPQAPPGGTRRTQPLFGTSIATWQEPDYTKSVNVHWAAFRDNMEARRDKKLSQRPAPAAVAVTENGAPGDKSAPKPRLIVFGTDTFIQDRSPIPTGADEYRQSLVSGSIDWLRERNANIGVTPRKVGVFVLEKPIDWTSQLIVLGVVGIGISALGVGVWLSRRR
jgi:ABC-type uncharacterized transport system